MYLRNLMRAINKKIWIIILVTFSSTLVSAYISYYRNPVLYESRTTLYVANKEPGLSTSLSYEDLQVTRNLIENYKSFIMSDLAASEVIKNLNLAGYSNEQIKKAINPVAAAKANVIEIRVRDKDKQISKRITESITDVLKNRAPYVIGFGYINVLDSASDPKPLNNKNILLITAAFLVSFLLSLILVQMLNYLDDSIKTPYDVEKRLNLKVLGTIPDFNL
ncbi:MAG: YveK family protein [Bacillota bacterium]